MIAVASKRDSAAMKTIAVLTIVFLPPTFVATFFSMTLFNWTPQTPGDRITSKYFWVYWVVAIPLTALVLIIWRLWWTMEEKRYRHDLRKAREERVTAISHSFSAAKRD
ncbi:hypothetical protein EJ04DRAFT_491412 [Polyplosphaeria fusca]|uniref:Uncharacterized protein n=1 Tax=Polyplosphaeria fusca TaxID=682080 RepID=A0A9P4V3P5_9PLEO|nr:hypothetical protein EJ04DRAFT_491412 [Polyplosphaeria fusca]